MRVLFIAGTHIGFGLVRTRMSYPLLAAHEGLHLFDRPRRVVDAGGVRVEFIGPA